MHTSFQSKYVIKTRGETVDELSSEIPVKSLVSPPIIVSVVLQAINQLSFLIAAIFLLANQSWYVEYKRSEKAGITTIDPSQENTVFTL